MTTFEISAQFGGTDAAQALLPHFRAVKSAHKGRSFDGFPFAELAFILRVDGEVSSYGQSGPGRVDIKRKGRYVSVDLGIPRDQWAGRSTRETSAFIAAAIRSSEELLRAEDRLGEVDWSSLKEALAAFAAAYEAIVAPLA